VAATLANRRQPACTRQIRLRVTYSMNIAWKMQFVIERRRPGRMRWNYVWAIFRASKAGTNSFILNSRIGPHKLTPGLYRLYTYDQCNQPTIPFQITR
jgi:hypothetical protein